MALDPADSSRHIGTALLAGRPGDLLALGADELVHQSLPIIMGADALPRSVMKLRSLIMGFHQFAKYVTVQLLISIS